MKTLRELKLEAEEQHLPLEERTWSLQQRLKAGQRARRRSKLLARAKQRAMRRMASPDVLQKRAQRSARTAMKTRLARGVNPAEMSAGQKIMLATKLKKFLPRIKTQKGLSYAINNRDQRGHRIYYGGRTRRKEISVYFRSFYDGGSEK